MEYIMDEDLKEYRKHIIKAEQKIQEEYDKSVLSLSGGALGVSFAFIKNIIGDKPIINSDFLFLAWLSWGLSIVIILASYYTSHLALRKTLSQIEEDDYESFHIGGLSDKFTAVFNALGGIIFFLGVIFISIFVRKNL